MLATAESKNQAVSKLESLIERGRSRAANVIVASEKSIVLSWAVLTWSVQSDR